MMRRADVRRQTVSVAVAVVLCSGAWHVTALSGAQQAPGAPPGRASPCPGCGYPPEPIDAADVTGWTQIFDGKTLEGWDGNPAVWKVENGIISAESTAERRVGSTYLIWRGGEPADFELKLEIKADRDIHSGVFYRGTVGPGAARGVGAGRVAGSATAGAPSNRPQPPPLGVPADPKWNVTGYSLDFDYGPENDGNVQDTGGRPETQIGWRGYIVRMEAGKRPQAIAAIGDRTAMMTAVKPGEWNALHIIARGNQLTHIVNGQVMAILIDDDAAARKSKGVIALQVEQYGTGKITFRNIFLRSLQ
jgi:hypothetical protein